MSHQGRSQRVTPLQGQVLGALSEHHRAKINDRGRYSIEELSGNCVLWVTQKTIDGLALRGLVTFEGVDGDVVLTALGKLEATRH